MNDVLRERGRSLMALGDFGPAAVELKELLLGTEDAAARRLKAECHVALGEYIEAERELLAVREKHPEEAARPEFLAELAMAHVLTDARREADEAIKAAKAADPDYAQALLAEVAYMWKFSRQGEAVTQLSDLVRIGVADEKKLKERPVLKDLIASPMWKKRTP